MKITVLGSGTSAGVPIIGCSCRICTSDNPKNERLRSSIYVELDPSEAGGTYAPRRILVDAGPDFREQALRYKIPGIDAVLFTHAHADHIFGLDDIRIYNFIQKSPIPVYAEDDTAKALKRIFNYCFEKDLKYEGGGIPKLTLHTISAGDIIEFGTCKVKALRAFHGSVPILGYHFGSFAYLTDCSRIPEKTEKELHSLPSLILDGLRHRPHKTHLTISEAERFALKNNIGKTYLTHLSHEVEHEETCRKLKESSRNRVTLAYDGLCITESTEA
jgi:phosphoribosyl 1,2-cyclic phosphate phosphodiesterase